jgi:hypothetical protein
MSSTTHACCLSCLGKQPVLLQLCQNYCASATDLQSADKTGVVIFGSNANKDPI